MHGTHCIGHWSKLQNNVVMSSGEAELNSEVKGLSELLAIRQLMEEVMGDKIQLEFMTDANACKGILLRKGAGRIKHLATKQLWSQEAILEHNVRVIKIPRDTNPSDLLTGREARRKIHRFKIRGKETHVKLNPWEGKPSLI